jgi:hypothetical protein
MGESLGMLQRERSYVWYMVHSIDETIQFNRVTTISFRDKTSDIYKFNDMLPFTSQTRHTTSNVPVTLLAHVAAGQQLLLRNRFDHCHQDSDSDSHHTNDPSPFVIARKGKSQSGGWFCSLITFGHTW